MIPRIGRLPHPRRDELPESAQLVYDAILSTRSAAAPSVADGEGRLAGPFNAMAQASQGIGMALQELGSAIRFRGTLPDRSRELAILTVAAARSCEFEWWAHSAGAAAVGLSDDMLESIARGDAGFFAGDDAVVHRAVTELLDGDLSQQTYLDAAQALGEAGVIDLTILVGYYGTLATMLRVFRVPLPEME